MEQGNENVVNLQEWEAQKNRELFSSVAEEIRDGTLQTHFGDNAFLFAKTDEILHFALEGEKLTIDLPDYHTQRAYAREEILKNLQATLEALSRYPRNDCQEVRESVVKMRSLVEKIKS